MPFWMYTPRFDMTKASFALLFALSMLAASCGGANSGTEFEWLTMPNAQKLAEANDKKIVVAVYTDWCTWCRKLENEVYPDPKIEAVISEYYYVVKVNAESDEEMVFNGHKIRMSDFAQQLGITSYPTTVFIGSDGKTIGQQNGYMEVEVFEKLLAYVGSNSYRHMQFDEFSVNSLPMKSGSADDR